METRVEMAEFCFIDLLTWSTTSLGLSVNCEVTKGHGT